MATDPDPSGSQPATRAARIAAGDVHAFEEVFEAELAGAVRYAASLLGGREAAEDVVQDAFLRLWQYRARLDASSDPARLLYTIIRNLAKNVLRRRAREQRGPTPEPAFDETASNDLGAVIQRALGTLSPRQREIVLYRWHRQLTYEQIATELGIAAGTVAAHMQRAMAQLREILPKLV